MIQTIDKLASEGWVLTPERFSNLAFLHRKRERILYDVINQREILKYNSNAYLTTNPSAKEDWKELQEILSK